jgi:stage V sporulation protein B
MKHSLSRGFILLTIASFFIVVSAYITNILLGRYLGPKDYGIYGLIISLMTGVNIIQNAGLPNAISKFISQDESAVDSILKSGLVLQVISTILITSGYYFSADYIAYVLQDPSLIPYIHISAFIFPVYGIYALYTNYYNGLHKFGKQSVLVIAYSLFKTAFVLAFAFLMHIQGAILGFIVAPLFALFTGFRLPNRNSKFFSYKKLILFSIPLIGFAFLSSLMQSIDLYFIKSLMHSDSSVGYYTANQNITRIPFYALSSLSFVIFPSISKNIGKNQVENIRQIIHKSLRLILILLIPASTLISFTSAQIIHLLFSDAYLPGTSSLAILIYGSGFFTIFTILANILNGADKPGKSVATSFIGVVVIAVSCVMLIPKYGLIGAAVSTLIGSFVSMAITSLLVYRMFHTLINPVSLIKISLASLLIGFISYLIPEKPILLPFTYSFLFLIYFFILYVFKEITNKDFLLINSILPTKFKIRIYESE